MNIRSILVLLLIAAMSLLSCEKSITDPTPPPTDTINRTVIIYMNSRNSLGSSDFDAMDSVEIMQGAKFLTPSDQILLINNSHNPAIYCIKSVSGSVSSTKVKEYPAEQNMSDPLFMKDLLEWTKTNFRSKSYGLTMWSHADGWLPSLNKKYSERSFGVDVGPDGNASLDKTKNGDIGLQMDIEDMASAIESSGIHFEFIFFDACMMQCVESCYTLRKCANYIIGSPAPIPGIGAQYTRMLRYAFFTEPFDPKEIINQYFEVVKTYPEYRNTDLVISAVKTSELDSLARITAEVLTKKIQGTYEPELSGVISYYLYDYYLMFRPEYYDINDAMRQMIPEIDYLRWKAQLNRCIVAKQSTETIYNGLYRTYIDLNHYSGMSMFIPQKRYTKNASRCYFGDLNEKFTHTAWYTDAGWKNTKLVEYVRNINN